MSQAPQHLTSSETHATCYGYFSRQSVCSLEPACPRHYIYRSLGRWLSNLDTCQSGFPIPPFTFCIKLIESVSMVGYVHCVTVASRGNIAESTCDCIHRITRERERENKYLFRRKCSISTRLQFSCEYNPRSMSDSL